MHSSSEITFTLLISECVIHTPLHRDHAAFLLISATLSGVLLKWRWVGICCKRRHQRCWGGWGGVSTAGCRGASLTYAEGSGVESWLKMGFGTVWAWTNPCGDNRFSFWGEYVLTKNGRLIHGVYLHIASTTLLSCVVIWQYIMSWSWNSGDSLLSQRAAIAM